MKLTLARKCVVQIRIMENGLFRRSGKFSMRVKWQKNFFRFSVVIGCSLVAWAGAADLDKFVSLVGSIAWCVQQSPG
jgi:proton-coupled amino acid transporter